MTKITIVMPFYLNAGMLAMQYANWAAWPQELKDKFEIIIVDDGSPEPAMDVPRPNGLPVLRIYRVLKDMPWHQHAARNLGAHKANQGWMLLTDMDHMLTEANAVELVNTWLDEKTIYTLARVEANTGLPTMKDGNPKPHPNSFVVTKKLYWKIGGYDEDYSGIYGTDGLFRSRAFAIAKRGHLVDVKLHRYWSDLVSDASTTTLQRKEGREPGARDRVTAEKAARGETDVIKVLQFEWEKVL